MTSYARTLITDADAQAIDVIRAEAQGAYLARTLTALAARQGFSSVQYERSLYYPHLDAATQEQFVNALGGAEIGERAAEMLLYAAFDREGMRATLRRQSWASCDERALRGTGAWPLHRDDLYDWEHPALGALMRMCLLALEPIADGEYDRGLGIVAYANESLGDDSFGCALEASSSDERRAFAILLRAMLLVDINDPWTASGRLIYGVEHHSLGEMCAQVVRGRMLAPMGDVALSGRLQGVAFDLVRETGDDAFRRGADWVDIEGVDRATWEHLAGRVLQWTPINGDPMVHVSIPLATADWEQWRAHYEDSAGWRGWRIFHDGARVYLMGEIGTEASGMRRSVGAMRTRLMCDWRPGIANREQWVREQVAVANWGFSADEVASMAVVSSSDADYVIDPTRLTAPGDGPWVDLSVDALGVAVCAHRDLRPEHNRPPYLRGWHDAQVMVCIECGMGNLEVTPAHRVPGVSILDGAAYLAMEEFYAVMAEMRDDAGIVVARSALAP